MIVSSLSTELIILQPNWIRWYIVINVSVLCKNGTVMFKVKVTGEGQNFIESLCILYLLYYWSLAKQTRYADVLFLITKASTGKWTYTDCNTLTYCITRQRGGGDILPTKRFWGFLVMWLMDCYVNTILCDMIAMLQHQCATWFPHYHNSVKLDQNTI